jgi:hypothetical protein
MLRFFLPALAGLLLMGGCVTTGDPRSGAGLVMVVDEQGLVAGTGIDAADLLLACTDLQRGMLTVPEIAGAVRPLHLLVEPVENDTRLTLNLAELDQAVHAQLTAGAPWQCRLLAAAGGKVEADYYVAGRLQRFMPDRPEAGERLLYTLQLIDARNSELVWVGLTELRHRPAAEPDLR